jgi:hypothetical protein
MIEPPSARRRSNSLAEIESTAGALCSSIAIPRWKVRRQIRMKLDEAERGERTPDEGKEMFEAQEEDRSAVARRASPRWTVPPCEAKLASRRPTAKPACSSNLRSAVAPATGQVPDG